MTHTTSAKSLSADFDVAILHAVARSETKAELEAITTTFCHRCGLERWIYAMIGPDIAVTNYDAEWLNFYAEHRGQRRRDPFLCAIYERRRAISWDLEKRRPWVGRLARMQQQIIDAKWDVGVRSGVSAPIFGAANHGFECAIISFSRDRSLAPSYPSVNPIRKKVHVGRIGQNGPDERGDQITPDLLRQTGIDERPLM